MNILYLSSEYPPETGNGGIGTYTQYIAEGMAARNHSVTVIAASSTNSEEVHYLGGVTVYRIPGVPYPLPQHRSLFLIRKCITALFPHTLVRICRCIAVQRKVHALLARCPPFDIIEAPECGAESLLLPHNACKVSVIRFHTPWEMVRSLDKLKEPPGDRVLLPILERLAVKRAKQLSSPSIAMQRYIENQWGVKRVRVIPNPLPMTRFIQRTGSGSGWIFTGRIERRKGVHLLIKAYLKVSAEYSESLPPLTLLGRSYGDDTESGDYGSYIRQLLQSSVHGQSIHWIDHVDSNGVISRLQRSSVAFFPSLWENYPYACLEAMACGCSVVATSCGGFPELIEDNRSGILVAPDSVDSLVTAMKQLIATPTITRTLGGAARDRVIALASSDRVCSTMEHFYQAGIRECT